ncbi:MAG TPA: hypothetical protein VED40_04945 [Azospirillaceae bacterium]|nr:hypothetical protein [Azospirillaceae bacterium]
MPPAGDLRVNPDLLLTQIRQRVEAQGRQLSCAACDGKDLIPPRNLTEGIALIYENPDADWSMAAGYLPVFPVTCRSCGHVMLFERRAIVGDTETPLF